MIDHIVIVGFGCIGQAVLPLLQRTWPRAAITVVDRSFDDRRRELVAAHGLHAVEAGITADTFSTVLAPLLRPWTFLLSLAPSVCSRDLIALAQSHGAFYIDAGIEPWDYAGDANAAELSNYALREQMLAFARGRETMPTALVAHGANPGMVSVLVKAALMELAGHAALQQAEPRHRAQWAALARRLDLRVIQISEYDSQQAPGFPRDGEFANTWPRRASSPNACRMPNWDGARTKRRCLPAATAIAMAAVPRSRSIGPDIGQGCAHGRRRTDRSTPT